MIMSFMFASGFSHRLTRIIYGLSLRNALSSEFVGSAVRAPRALHFIAATALPSFRLVSMSSPVSKP